MATGEVFSVKLPIALSKARVVEVAEMNGEKKNTFVVNAIKDRIRKVMRQKATK